jgi:hypothetical protein
VLYAFFVRVRSEIEADEYAGLMGEAPVGA